MALGDRHARQKLLPEIGVEGQARIDSARFAVDPSAPREAREVALLYAQAAGFDVSAGDAASPRPVADRAPFAHGSFFRHSSALHLAEGAHLVLDRLRVVLGLTQARQDGPPRSPDRPHR